MRIVRSILLSMVLLLTLLANGFLLPASVSATATVTPATFSATISPESQASFDITVNTGPKPIPKVDVVFAIDRTGSMGDEIAVVQAKAVEIMNDIRIRVSDSWFGLVSFMDYPGSYDYPGYSSQYGSADSGDVPYVVNQQPTDDTTAVVSAINVLSLGWGADEPQDYSRVLYEAMSLDWRPVTKKIVIMFGDAPTHDLDFAGYNFGGDPGRDGTAQTADDLDFETVVSQVSQEGITVLSVQGSMYEPMQTYAAATFRGMSSGFDVRAKEAIDWALGDVGDTSYSGYCLKFVQDAYALGATATLTRYSYAKEAADALGASSNLGVPPWGAYVFYDYYATIDGVYKNWGHVGLSLGDGRIVEAYGNVTVADYDSIGLNYIGWAWPPLTPAMFTPPLGVAGTGGQYYLLASADQIPIAVQAMMEQEVSSIGHLTLSVPDAYKDWISFSPADYENVGPDTIKLFQVTITVPKDTSPSEDTFLIQVLGDGALLGSCSVSIIVPQEIESFDLGFRPKPDGYSFVNSAGIKLTWDMFQRFFGTNVVMHSNGDRVYAAEQYFYSRYEDQGGACDGMSSSSLLLWDQGPEAWYVQDPGTHTETGNDGKQHPYFNHDLVSDYFGYRQGFQTGYEMIAYDNGLSDTSPNDIYQQVKAYIQNGDPVVLHLLHYDSTAKEWYGHAVVPFKIEEGNGLFGLGHHDAKVYVYDPNDPDSGQDRWVKFDLTDNTWEYTMFGWSWFITWFGQPWSGPQTVDGQVCQNIRFVPLSMFTHAGIAPWTTKTVIANVSGSAHLLFTDASGERLGYENGVYLDEILEGGPVIPVGQGSPSESYFLSGTTSPSITLSGTADGKANIDIFGDNSLIQIKDVTVDPSTIDNLTIGRGSTTLTYTTNDENKQYTAILDQELPDTSRVVSVHTSISAGDTPILELTGENTFEYINNGEAKTYDLMIEQRGAGAGEFSSLGLAIGPDETQIVSIADWNNLDSTTITVAIDKNSDGIIDEQKTLQDKIPPQVIITSPVQGQNYLNTRGTIPVQYTATDNCDNALDIASMLDGNVFTGNTINLCGMASGQHTLVVSATDDFGNTGTASSAFTVVPKAMKSFVIKNLNIQWAPHTPKSKGSDSFSIFGRLQLPQGYTWANLQSQATITISIGGKSGNDTVVLKGKLYGRPQSTLWSYRGSEQPPGYGMNINNMVIWLAPQRTNWNSWAGFYIGGVLQLPGDIGVSTKPSQVTVTLEIPVTTASGCGSLMGQQTVTCSVTKLANLWFYNAWPNLPTFPCDPTGKE